MFWQQKINDCIDRDSALEYRLQLLEYFALITGSAWAFLCLTNLVLVNQTIALFSFAGALTSFATMALIKSRPETRPFLANLFLFCNVMILCGYAMATGAGHSQSAVYFPIVVFLAAQLVGFRVAVVWSIALLSLSIADYCRHVGLGNSHIDSVDRIFHGIGTIGTALWLSFESEKFFNLRTRHLESITESLQEKTRLLELAEGIAGVGHWRWNPATGLVELSAEASQICNFEAAQTQIGLEEFVDVWSEATKDKFLSHFSTNVDASLEGFGDDLTTKGRIRKHVSCHGIFERGCDNQIVGVFGTLRDDTQLRSTTDRLTVKAEELNQLASFDPLTGLANRFQFQKQLDQRVKESVESGQQMALLVLDMDGFKIINDTLGHAIGDEVLKVAAKRLTEIVRDGDLVSRLGGDEFTVIVRSAESPEEIEAVAKRIVNAISKPMKIDGQELHAGVSIGSSLAPRDSENADELFTYADTAMYEAKAANKGLEMYRSEMTEELLNRRSAENRLAGALEREEFELVFQPQCNIKNGTLVGFETLLRWTSDGKKVPPLQFIPLLEGNGKIVEVGQWVLERSCEQVARWNKMGFRVNIAVNISPIQFRESDFSRRVIETIRRYQVDPSQIELEITEGLLIQDLANTNEKLFALKEFGTRISVDDFGTGYSSLAYLKHLPIDQLKIDREFIKDIPEHDDGTIASSIILLGQSLDMEVLAEGVETKAQLDFLRANDCCAYQGNLLGRPMPAEHCSEMLSQKLHDAGFTVPVVR
jgi:diguanylate cyclase (GGDEF)-like protein